MFRNHIIYIVVIDTMVTEGQGEHEEHQRSPQQWHQEHNNLYSRDSDSLDI